MRSTGKFSTCKASNVKIGGENGMFITPGFLTNVKIILLDIQTDVLNVKKC